MEKGYTSKIFEKDFSDEVSKQAYLKATKWLAINVYGKGNLSEHITVKINKLEEKKDQKETVFRVELYFMVNFDEMQNSHCNVCRQTTNMFMNNRPNCQECKFNAFLSRVKYETETMASRLSERFEEEND